VRLEPTLKAPSRPRTLLAAVTVALSLGVAGCSGGTSTATAPTGSSASSDTAWAGSAGIAKAIDDLYSATTAAGESELVLYGPYAQLFQPLWDQFHSRFPKVTIVPKVLPATATAATVAAEVQTGPHVGDVIMMGLAGVGVPADKDQLEPYQPPNASTLPSTYRDAKGRFVVQFGDVFGSLFNSSKMTAEETPGSLADLLDPKYKGQVMDNPTLGVVSAFMLLPHHVKGQVSADYLVKLKANSEFVEVQQPYYPKVAAGQVPLMPFVGHAQFATMKQAGATVGWVAKPGLGNLVLGASGIIKGAPHLNAAKLFQAWFVTPEAQQLIVDKGNTIGLLPGLKLPAELQDYTKLTDAVPVPDVTTYAQLMSQFTTFAKQTLGS